MPYNIPLFSHRLLRTQIHMSLDSHISKMLSLTGRHIYTVCILVPARGIRGSHSGVLSEGLKVLENWQTYQEYPRSNQVSYVQSALLTGKCSGLVGLAVGVYFVCIPQGGSQYLRVLGLAALGNADEDGVLHVSRNTLAARGLEELCVKYPDILRESPVSCYLLCHSCWCTFFEEFLIHNSWF